MYYHQFHVKEYAEQPNEQQTQGTYRTNRTKSKHQILKGRGKFALVLN
jgi:hypothetical protein